MEYPRYRHNGDTSVLVKTYEEEMALGEGWYDSPSAAWKAKAQKPAEDSGTKPFSELTDKMSPEAQQEIKEGTQEIVNKIDISGLDFGGLDFKAPPAKKPEPPKQNVPQYNKPNERKFDNKNFKRGR